MNNEQAIEEQKKRIEHYEGVLERYGRGRWYNLGRRTLQEMQEQLQALQANATPTHERTELLTTDVSDTPTSPSVNPSTSKRSP